MPIDTLKAAKRLQEDDTFSPEQAERIAEILSELDVASATKEDLDDLETRLGERIDRLSERVDGLETRMQARFEQVDERFDQVDERFEQVEARFEQVEARFEQMEARFDQIDEQFDRVDAQFDQIDERFDRVDARFEQVDRERASMEERLTQRIELSESRTDSAISELRSDLYRALLLGFGAVAALVTILNYLVG